VLSYQIQQQPVGGKITLICHLPADGGIFRVVEIVVVFIKYRVVPQSEGLMDLKIKTHRSHIL
jgi:hypothetical protein